MPPTCCWCPMKFLYSMMMSNDISIQIIWQHGSGLGLLPNCCSYMPTPPPKHGYPFTYAITQVYLLKILYSTWRVQMKVPPTDALVTLPKAWHCIWTILSWLQTKVTLLTYLVLPNLHTKKYCKKLPVFISLPPHWREIRIQLMLLQAKQLHAENESWQGHSNVGWEGKGLKRHCASHFQSWALLVNSLGVILDPALLVENKVNLTVLTSVSSM